MGSRLLREIRERGYTSGYTAVSDFLRDVRPPAIQGFEVRFETLPGEQVWANFAKLHVVFTHGTLTKQVTSRELFFFVP